ncbi:MAG: AMP-binding protein, partial [Candidatus Sumerlaeota bacterium]|nr:AMP-binding protein [Candidatus Sumerlaeota bacterium]
MAVELRDSYSPAGFWALNLNLFFRVFGAHLFRWLAFLMLIASAVSEEAWVWPFFAICVLWVAPFLSLTPAAGILADRRNKRNLAVSLSLYGIIISGVGALALVTQWPWLLYLTLLLWAIRDALIEPCQYALIPELVPPSRLSHANGWIAVSACAGIILGVCGAIGINKATQAGFVRGLGPGLTLALAALALAACAGIPDTGARAPQKKLNPSVWKDFGRVLRQTREDRNLKLAQLGIGFFMFLAGCVLTNLKGSQLQCQLINFDNAPDSLLIPWLMLTPVFGVMAGAWWAGHVTRRGIELGLVPFGALVVSVAPFLLALPLGDWIFRLLLIVMGAGGGCYLITLRAFLQREARREDRGEIVAGAILFAYCGLALGWLLVTLLDKALGLGPSARFAILGILTLSLCAQAVWTMPDFLIHFLGLITARVSYRLRVVGAENIPTQGGALLVCNHVSYLDVALLMATQARRIRFLIDQSLYQRRLFKWLLDLLGTIPIDYAGGPKAMARAYEEARMAIADGFLVCLFAEGSLTRTGYIMEFRSGFERITDALDSPIIPVNIHGVWGSVLTYAEGRIFGRLSRWFYGRRVIISIGKPLPAHSSAFLARQAVMELESDAFELERDRYMPLPLEFARMARARWGRFCMADSLGKELTYGRALTGALALAKVLRPLLNGQKRVGVLMPTTVSGSLTNLALAFLGKTPVNLNYTASLEAIHHAIRQCGIQTILTSSKFLEKVEFLKDLPGLKPLEDIAPLVTGGVKLRAFLKARFCPLRYLMVRDGGPGRRRYGASLDEEAVVIYSSGSTGMPKGVVLTHYNILSNALGVLQIFHLRPDDVICGVLPFFHSFGFMVTIWLPVLAGVGVAYHANPLEAVAIGKLVKKYRCAFLASTPTFLQAYTRKLSREDFEPLRIVITGAEKLKDRVAAAFHEKFGMMPLEGYGCTELSPVASVNMLDVEAGGERQVANRPGTIGRPIPGVTMKVADPDEMDRELEHGQEGMLLVKGPNVMKGYLDDPEKTAEVLRKGWYVTGDMARIDHDGFVTITDRRSRFSKIGGEMVPHLAIEEALHERLRAEGQVCAVTSLPDEKKGEQLVALLTPEAGDPLEAYIKLKASGFPNLWIPPARNFITVEALPLLGSGKLDLKGLKTLAAKKLAERSKAEKMDAPPSENE